MKVTINGGTVRIEGELHDEFLRQVLEESSKDQSVEEAFGEILLLGAKVKEVILTTATTQLLAKSVEDVKAGLEQLETNHGEFLRGLMEELASEDSSSDVALVRRLREWAQAFDRKLETEFDDTNSAGTVAKIKAAVDKHLAQRESELANLLSLTPDPHAMSPRPLKDVFDKTQEILTKLTERDAVKKSSRVKARTGNDFESAVYDVIQSIADEYQDLADDPGRQKLPGVDGNHEGDITVEYRFDSISSISGKLVLEAKFHNSPKSKPSLLLELGKGISNREADYGILVTNESGYKLSGDFPFWEDWGNRRAILVVEDDFENLNEDKIRFAYLLAKARIRDLRANLDADTLEQVVEQIATINKSFAAIRQVKSTHTTASTALAEMVGHIGYLEKHVGEELSSLHSKITRSGNKDSE